ALFCQIPVAIGEECLLNGSESVLRSPPRSGRSRWPDEDHRRPVIRAVPLVLLPDPPLGRLERRGVVDGISRLLRPGQSTVIPSTATRPETGTARRGRAPARPAGPAPGCRAAPGWGT